MGFEVKADPATINVFKNFAAKVDEEREGFLAFVAAFARLFSKTPERVE